MGVAELILSIITLVVGGIMGGVSGGIAAKKTKLQAQQLERNAKQIKKQLEEGAIQQDEALKRLNTMMNQTTGELKEMLVKNVNDAIDKYTMQYERMVQMGTQQLKDAMVSRRMGASESLLAGTKQISDDLGRQYTQSVESIREEGLKKLFEAINALNQKRYDISEDIITDFEGFKFGLENELMSLDNAVSALQPTGGIGGQVAMGALSGAMTSGAPEMFAKWAADYDPQKVKDWRIDWQNKKNAKKNKGSK